MSERNSWPWDQDASRSQQPFLPLDLDFNYTSDTMENFSRHDWMDFP